MNTELKSLINVVFDGIKIEQDVVNKKAIISILPDVFKLLSDIGPAVQHAPGLLDEIKQLPGSEHMLDLISFIQSKLGQLSDAIIEKKGISHE